MSQHGEATLVPDDAPNVQPTEQEQAADGSEALFSMYNDRALAEDMKMVESWKGDAEGMLVFTGLFSAAVAALLALSVPTILRNPQDTASFYLARLYQQAATQPNGTQPPIPDSLTDPIEPFVPPTWGVWVNGLWFTSLVISLTCGLLATLLQQWARRYLRVAYPSYSPHKRARIRAFYKFGVEKLHIPWTIEVLPALLHISLFLFFAGLSVFLFNVHPTIFKIVTAWTGLCALLYAVLTFMPIIRKDSPYSAPLSSSFSFCLTGIRHLFFRFLQRFPNIDPAIFTPLRSRDPRAVHLGEFFSHSMSKTAEEYALKMDAGIDHRSLLWTFQSLDEDSELEKFFERLPRLCDSEIGRLLDLQKGFIIPNKSTLSNALIQMMNRTLLSNLAPESVKQRRLIVCTKALEATSLFGPWWILRCVLVGSWSRFLGCIDFGLFIQKWKDITHPVTRFYGQCVAALTISIVRDHDDRWYRLVGGLLGVSNTLLQEYIEHGDSVLLANVIFIVRRTVQTYTGSVGRHRPDIIEASLKTLETICKLDIRNTLPELQHEFCGLWNQLVATAQSDPPLHHGIVAVTTLKNIRKLYIALHQRAAGGGTPPTPFYTTTDDRDPILDNPKSYPMCTADDHVPSEPIPALQFDEPAPDAADGPPSNLNTPNMSMTPMLSPTSYPPIRPPNFPMPSPYSPPSTPYHTTSAPAHYSPHLVNAYSHLGTPPPDAVPFPQPQLAPTYAPNVQPGITVQPPPPPPPPPAPPAPPRISTSSVPSVYLDNASAASDLSGGYGQSSLSPHKKRPK